MTRCFGMFCWLLLVLLIRTTCGAQPYPMRYRPDLQPQGDTLRLRGRGWSFTSGAQDGSGWTTVYSSDFDQDGQLDYLVASLSPGATGKCASETSVLVLLMDSSGRPTVWRFSTYLPESQAFPNASFPFWPVWVMTWNGRAVFLPTTCQGQVSGAFAARGGQLEPRPGLALAPYARWTGALQWASGEKVEDRTAAPAGTLDEIALPGTGPSASVMELRVGETWTRGEPEIVIIDSTPSRDVQAGNSWAALLSGLRNGWTVRRVSGINGLLFTGVEAARATTPVAARWVTQSRTAGKGKRVGECWLIYAGSETARACDSRWLRIDGGTRESNGGDHRSVETEHMAMQHSVHFTTTFDPPSPDARLSGAVTMGDYWITQWGPRRHALHGSDGKLLLPLLVLEEDGLLVSGQAGLTFLRKDGSTVSVSGRIHLSRP